MAGGVTGGAGAAGCSGAAGWAGAAGAAAGMCGGGASMNKSRSLPARCNHCCHPRLYGRCVLPLSALRTHHRTPPDALISPLSSHFRLDPCFRIHHAHRPEIASLDRERAAGMAGDVQACAPRAHGSNAPRLASIRQPIGVYLSFYAPHSSPCACLSQPMRMHFHEVPQTGGDGMRLGAVQVRALCAYASNAPAHASLRLHLPLPCLRS